MSMEEEKFAITIDNIVILSIEVNSKKVLCVRIKDYLKLDLLQIK